MLDQAYSINMPFGPTVSDYRYPMYPASLISNMRNAPYPYSQVYASNHIRDSKIKTSVPGVRPLNGEKNPDADFFLGEEIIAKKPPTRVKRAFTEFELPKVLYCSISDADVKRLGRYGVRVGTSFYRSRKILRKHVEDVQNIIRIYSSGKEAFFWKEKNGFSNLVPIKSDYTVLPKRTEKETDIDSKGFEMLESVAGTQDAKISDTMEFLNRRSNTKTTRDSGFSKWRLEDPEKDLVTEIPTVDQVEYGGNFSDDPKKFRRRKRRLR